MQRAVGSVNGRICEEGALLNVTYFILVSEPLTKSILATCLALAVPPMLEPVPPNERSPLKSSSLRVLLPTRASQRNFVPSSTKLFLASDSFVSEPLAASAGARASAPTAPRLL